MPITSCTRSWSGAKGIYWYTIFDPLEVNTRRYELMNFWFRFQAKKSVKILVLTMARIQTICNTESEIFHLFLGCQIIFMFMVELVLLQWKPKNIILAQSNQERYIHIWLAYFIKIEKPKCNQIRKLCQICSWSYWTTNISIKMLEGKFKYKYITL